jgi:hypothetical protein
VKRLRSLLAPALVVLAACDAGERRDAEGVVAAVERFRRAENADKPRAVEALRGARCSGADVCRARDACLASAEPTAKALRLKDEVEKSLKAVEQGTLAKDSPEARSLVAKLDEAEALLNEGHDRLGACDEQMSALKRKHRL